MTSEYKYKIGFKYLNLVEWLNVHLFIFEKKLVVLL